MKWQLTPICSDRAGPSRAIKVAPDARKAGRAFATIEKIVAGLHKNNSCLKSRAGLRDLLVADDETTSDLRAAVSGEAAARFWKELASLLVDLAYPRAVKPETIKRLVNKAAALRTKINEARDLQAADDEARWLSNLFERNASMAHKWCNAPNTMAPIRVASDGKLSPLSHLDD